MDTDDSNLTEGRALHVALSASMVIVARDLAQLSSSFRSWAKSSVAPTTRNVLSTTRVLMGGALVVSDGVAEEGDSVGAIVLSGACDVGCMVGGIAVAGAIESGA